MHLFRDASVAYVELKVEIINGVVYLRMSFASPQNGTDIGPHKSESISFFFFE